MRLTARSEYGLLALVDLACRTDEGPQSAREISERQNVPGKFLEQLLVALRRAGLVQSIRGARGGFMLARDPSRISVLEAVEALEGPLAPTVCAHEDCGRSHACAAGIVWEQVATTLRDVLGKTTLADVARRQVKLDTGKGA